MDPLTPTSRPAGTSTKFPKPVTEFRLAQIRLDGNRIPVQASLQTLILSIPSETTASSTPITGRAPAPMVSPSPIANRSSITSSAKTIPTTRLSSGPTSKPLSLMGSLGWLCDFHLVKTYRRDGYGLTECLISKLVLACSNFN